MYLIIDCEACIHIGDNHPSAGTDLIIWFLLLMPRGFLGVGGIVFCKVGLWIQFRPIVNSEDNFPSLALGYLVF